MRTREYSTDELLLIANNVTGEYTDKQVRQAKLELYNRGVDDKVIADIMEEKEEAFMRRLDAAARAEKARMDKQNEKNRNVSYRWWEMLVIFIFAPFYLCRQHYLPSDFFPKLKQLKAEKYEKIPCTGTLFPEYGTVPPYPAAYGKTARTAFRVMQRVPAIADAALPLQRGGDTERPAAPFRRALPESVPHAGDALSVRGAVPYRHSTTPVQHV